MKKLSGKWAVFAKGEGAPVASFPGKAQAESFVRQLKQRNPDAQYAIYPTSTEALVDYRAPHFQPVGRGAHRNLDPLNKNLVAHVRFDVRPDADGRITLFIEEIQSDWHQEGARFGYYDPRILHPKIDELTARYTDAIHEYNDLRAAYEKVAQSGKLPDHERIGALVAVKNAELEMLKLKHELEAARNATSGVIDAPLKHTWPMTAIRRMIRYAVDENIDQIGWTTGRTQSDRYNQTLANITVAEQTPDGEWVVMFKNYRYPTVLNRPQAAELERLLGDRQPIVRDGGTKVYDLHQQPLTISSAGMRAFYDERLVNSVNKWAKKYGAQVEKFEVAKEQPWLIIPHPVPGSPNAVWVENRKTGQLQWFGTPAAAQEFLKGRRQRVSTEKAYRLRITPRMREAAKKGMEISRIPTQSMAA